MSIWSYCPGVTPHPQLADLLARQYCFDHLPAGSHAAEFIWRSGLEQQIADLRLPCRYCKNLLQVHYGHDLGTLHCLDDFRHLFACDQCGWWFLVDLNGDSAWKPDLHPDTSKINTDLMPMAEECFHMRPVGVVEAKLATFEGDVDDLSIDEIRQYLLAKADSRFSLHPRRFEEVVGAVFRDIGYHVVVTNYSADGGIDAVLSDSSGIQIGVQVKRYRDRIKVAQLRELLGALVLNGMTRGLFVTTSEFQRGAREFSKQCQSVGFEMDLMDGDRFMSALGLRRRLPFTSIEDFETAFVKVKTHRIGHIVNALVAA